MKSLRFLMAACLAASLVMDGANGKLLRLVKKG